MSQTLLIILITAAISIYALNEQSLIGKLIMDPILVKNGQYYRLLTSGFIHADYQHLIFNMFTLYSFGKNMEYFFNRHGSLTFLIVYLVAIIVSSIPAYIKNKDNTRYLSLGASGGVSAILFAYILLDPWAMFTFPPVPAIVFGIIYLAYTYYMSKRNIDNIGHDAHFTGALVGILATIILEPSVVTYFFRTLMSFKIG